MFDANANSPAIPGYLICDAAFIKKYGLGLVYPGAGNLSRLLQAGYLKRAAKLDDLAGVRRRRGGPAPHGRAPQRLAQTGIDADFGKGETELNRFNGDDAHKPNPCIGPLAVAPFYGMEIWPADIAVSTGLSTDADARVLDTAGQPMTGLYACGNDMASIMRGSYPGPGTTLGPGMVFAYRAAMHAAGKAPLEEPIAGG